MYVGNLLGKSKITYFMYKLDIVNTLQKTLPFRLTQDIKHFMFHIST